MNADLKPAILSCVFVLSMFLFSPASVLSAESHDALHLEGVVIDAKNPDESVAILNGNMLKKGEMLDQFKLVEIQSGFVLLRDEKTGKDVQLQIKEDLIPDYEITTEPFSQNVDEVYSEPSAKNPTENTAFPRLEKSWELKAVTDLRDVYRGIFVYYGQHRESPASLQDLEKAGLVKNTYPENISGKYLFTLMMEGDAQGVRADPVQGNPRLRHFFVDKFGIVRYRNGKPADDKSPIYTEQ